MKREEKNQQAQRRILDSALVEFSQRGYGGSSINNICAVQDISKGIIYHYFRSKDDLYLACIDECFQRLTAYMHAALENMSGSIEEKLERYFSARMAFFHENPIYSPIFCEAVIAPPAALSKDILALRADFDALTISTLKQLLDNLPLRPHITMEEAIDLFRQFQDFINAKYRESSFPAGERFAIRDEYCRKLLDILLYGVVERSNT